LKSQAAVGSVRSADGTSIAYDREGRGPAVILVGGGLVEVGASDPYMGRSINSPLPAKPTVRSSTSNQRPESEASSRSIQMVSA